MLPRPPRTSRHAIAYHPSSLHLFLCILRPAGWQCRVASRRGPRPLATEPEPRIRARAQLDARAGLGGQAPELGPWRGARGRARIRIRARIRGRGWAIASTRHRRHPQGGGLGGLGPCRRGPVLGATVGQPGNPGGHTVQAGQSDRRPRGQKRRADREPEGSRRYGSVGGPVVSASGTGTCGSAGGCDCGHGCGGGEGW